MGASGERVIFYFFAWEVVPLGRSLSSVYFSNYILNLTTLFKVVHLTQSIAKECLFYLP